MNAIGWLFLTPLPVIALRDAADGKIFIEVGPVKAEGRKLDVVQLGCGRGGETWIR